MIVLAVFSPPLFAGGAANSDGFAQALSAYKAGDFSKAKALFLGITDFKSPEEKAYRNLLLANTCAATGDLELAKTAFPQAFESVPAGNEYPLASAFSGFCDANKLFSFELEYLEPFYAKNPQLLKGNSMLAYRYARALNECSKSARAREVLENLWRDFAADASAEGVDKILFDPSLTALLKDFAASNLPGGKPEIARLRAEILSGGKIGEIPENLSLGLALWLAQNTETVDTKAMESAVEASEGSAFAWKVLYFLAKKYFGEKEYALAFGFASRADTLSPDSIADTWGLKIFMGDCMRFMGRPKESVEYYAFVSRNPSCQGAAAAEALFKTGLAFYETQKYGEASYFFQYVVLAYPADEKWTPKSYYYGALSQVKLGNNLIAKNFLRDYLRRAKNRDSQIYRDIQALWSNIGFD